MPSPAAPALARHSGAWAEARALLWAERWRLGLGAVLMVINQTSSLVLPWSTKYLVDDVIANRDIGRLHTLVAAIAVAAVIQAASAFLQSRVLGVAAERAVARLQRRVARHVLRMPVRAFDRMQSGQLIARILHDAEGVRHVVGTELVDLVGSLATGALAFAVLLYIDWRLTAGTLVVVGVFGAGMAYAFRRLRPVFRERGAIVADITGRLNQALGGVRVVKTYSAERREDLVFARGAHRLLRNQARTITGMAVLVAFSDLVVAAIGIVVFLAGGRAILDGSITIGDLFRYLAFTAMLAMPIFRIAQIGTGLTDAVAGLDRIHEILSTPREDEGDAGREPLEDVGGDIHFEDVWYEYDAGVPVLKGVTFTARAGTTTALVGSSGSGKSTILNLVMGFDRPQRGVVTVDTRDLTTIRLADYRRHLGVVLQDAFLFDGSVGENIAYGAPHASEDAIRQASRIAHADEFIAKLADGYDTRVGERGVRLSGGQRQRLAIARAILANPRVLLLDEATSSVDLDSERLIQDGLRALRRGRTTMVIAHRLSTVRSADEILVVEDGAIVERGTHEALIEAGGRYRELYDGQAELQGDIFVNPGEEFPPIPSVDLDVR